MGERVHNRAGNFFCNYRRPAGHRSIAAAAAVYLFSAAAALLSGCAPVYAGHQHLESWYADALAALEDEREALWGNTQVLPPRANSATPPYDL